MMLLDGALGIRDIRFTIQNVESVKNMNRLLTYIVVLFLFPVYFIFCIYKAYIDPEFNLIEEMKPAFRDLFRVLTFRRVSFAEKIEI